MGNTRRRSRNTGSSGYSPDKKDSLQLPAGKNGSENKGTSPYFL